MTSLSDLCDTQRQSPSLKFVDVFVIRLISYATEELRFGGIHGLKERQKMRQLLFMERCSYEPLTATLSNVIQVEEMLYQSIFFVIDCREHQFLVGHISIRLVIVSRC